jgi:hypothetical protein
VKIGYAKIGRSMQFDVGKGGFQGNPTVRKLLDRLARRNPEHTFVLVGKNDGKLDGLPSNIENPWEGKKLASFVLDEDGGAVAKPDNEAFEAQIIEQIASLDAIICHAGQHGTSHFPIPPTPNTWKDCEEGRAHLTKPFIWARNYGAYLVKGMNLLGDRTDGQTPVVYVCEDSRNHMKARDIKWPSGEDAILAQYQYTKEGKHQRFGDPRTPGECGFRGRIVDSGEVWMTEQRYIYGGLEFMTLDDDWATWGTRPFEDRIPAGVGTTSHNRGKPSERRSVLVRDYMLAAFPDAEVQGKWDDVSLLDCPGLEVRMPVPTEYADDLAHWKTTLVLPVAGSGWSTAKPWQVFAANTVAFHVSRVDEQGWIVPSRTKAPETEFVGTVFGKPLFSVRNDWSEDELFLARWTRVMSPDEFDAAAKKIVESKELWTRLVAIQRNLLTRRWNEWLTESMIEERLGLR